MAIKLILSDIDGTILPQGSARVSQRTIDAFHAALAAGIAVGPCSGRGHAWIAPFFGGDAACCATAIATNGLQIYQGGECVLEKTLPAGALARVRDIAAATPHAGLVTFEDGVPYLVEGTREDLAECFGTYADTCVPAELPDHAIVKANVFCNAPEPEVAAFVERLRAEVPELDIDRAMPRFSNMMCRGWNKGAAIAWLCERLGIGLDEVLVFGDGDNDIPMFRAVEHSVAVAGAAPHAAAEARWHIGACEDDAVAQAIEAIAAGEWPFTE